MRTEHLTRTQFEPHLEKLLSYISSRVVVTGECWEFVNGSRHKGGYGIVSFKRKRYLAHRIVYALTFGETPGDNLCVLHRCDNPPCIRPHHFFSGTQADNMHDMAQKGRSVNPVRENPALALRGEASPNSKLSDDRVREIRERYAAGGESVYSLAADYGVGKSTIHIVVTRKTWAHVK